MGKTFLMNLIKVTKAYKNIRNFTIGHRDEYTTSCLLDYIYSKTTTRRLQYI